MAATKYTYSIASDTLNGAVFATTIKKTILESSIVTAFDYILTNGDVLDVWFKSSISAGDETTLGSIISAHNGVDTGTSDDPSLPNGSIDERFYKQVPLLSTETKDFVPPAGKEIHFHKLGGSGGLSTDIRVEIIWDPDGSNEILFSTHSSIEESTTIIRAGNGTKKCRIRLINDTSLSATFGAHYVYTLV